jgi:hypothetical protein
MRRRLVLGCWVIGCAGVAVAGALAAMSGAASGVKTLSRQTQLSSYQLRTDAAGAGTVLWSTTEFVGPQNDVAAVLRVRQQNANGGWSAPQQVGGITQTNEAELVESASGAAAVVWYYVQGGPRARTVLMTATRRSADGRWSAPKMIWSAANADGLMMAVSIEQAGVATVAWSTYGETSPAIWVSTVSADNGAISRPAVVVGAGHGGTGLGLAENAAGAAVLSWQHRLSPAHPVVGSGQRFAEMAIQRPATSNTWAAPQRLGTFSTALEPTATEIWAPSTPSSVVTANGTAAVGWRAGGGESMVPLEVSTHAAGSAGWSPPHALTGNLGGFGLVAGAHDQLVAVWSTDTPKQLSLISATSAGPTAWSKPTQLARIRQGTFGPILAAAPNGEIALTPLSGNATPIQYATRSPNGRWSSLKRVGTGDNPEITVTSSGSVTVLWETFNQHGQYKLQTRTEP